MNCFPCKGPACNTCGKYTQLNSKVAKSGIVRCERCGGKVDLETGKCENCDAQALPAPGLHANL